MRTLKVVSFLTVLLGLAGFYLLEPRIEIQHVPIEVPRKEKAVVELIKEYSKVYNVPWQLALAVHLHETNDGKWLYRFEPGKMSAAAKYAGYPEEQRALASSHGAMHVLGLTAHGYGVHWSKLYGDEGIELGVMYLAKWWHKYKHLSMTERTNKTLLSYNGGGDPTYPGKVSSKLAGIMLSEIGNENV